MGHATTVASAFTAVMLIAGLAILITTSLSTIGVLTNAVEEQTSLSEIVLNERVSIDSWVKDDAKTLRVNITNTGETSIGIIKFPKTDLFATYSNAGVESTTWVGYNQTGSTMTHWKVNRVFFKGAEGDLINPFKLTEPTHGVWDPDETLEFKIFIDASVQEFVYVTFTTPNGIKASCSLDLDEQSGTATLISGNTFVTVSHDLGRVPQNVQVTPVNQLVDANFWVSDLTSTTFRINISSSQAGDVGFYWQIK